MARVEPIRDPAKWLASMKNFESWLGDVVPGASDVDFMCERNGAFLFIELKEWFSTGGIKMPYGQHLALYRLSLQPNTTLYLLGEKGEDLYLTKYDAIPPEVIRRNGKPVVWWRPERFERVSRGEVREEVQRWWEEASRRPRPQAQGQAA